MAKNVRGCEQTISRKRWQFLFLLLKCKASKKFARVKISHAPCTIYNHLQSLWKLTQHIIDVHCILTSTRDWNIEGPFIQIHLQQIDDQNFNVETRSRSKFHEWKSKLINWKFVERMKYRNRSLDFLIQWESFNLLNVNFKISKQD